MINDEQELYEHILKLSIPAGKVDFHIDTGHALCIDEDGNYYSELLHRFYCPRNKILPLSLELKKHALDIYHEIFERVESELRRRKLRALLGE